VKALTSDTPKRRYRPNGDAKAAVFMKRFLGDPVVDRIVPRMSIG